jgi:hypothetical protein
MLCPALMRAAEFDWFERGDVWAKVIALNPANRTHPLTSGSPSSPPSNVS